MFSVVSRIVCSKYKQMDFCETSLLLPPGRTPILHFFSSYPLDFCLCTDSKQLSEVESSAAKLLFIASQAWWQCWSISVPWSQISPSLFQFFFFYMSLSLIFLMKHIYSDVNKYILFSHHDMHILVRKCGTQLCLYNKI